MRVVGADEEAVAGVLQLVLVARLARGDQPRLRRRLVRLEHAQLAGHVVARGDHDEAPRVGLADADEEGAVGLLVDRAVVARGRAQDMGLDPEGAQVLVELDVEQGLAVGRPDHRAAGVGERVVEHPAAVDLLDGDGEALGAVGIGAVGQQGLVRADVEIAQGEVVVALGQRRLVEDQLLAVLPADRGAEPLAVLRALLEAPPVEVGAVLGRDRGIVFLEAPLELVEDPAGQRLARRHDRLEVGVLGLQVVEHRGVRHLGIASVAQPGVVVDQRRAVDGLALRPAGGLGRLGLGEGGRLGTVGHGPPYRGGRRTKRKVQADADCAG